MNEVVLSDTTRVEIGTLVDEIQEAHNRIESDAIRIKEVQLDQLVIELPGSDLLQEIGRAKRLFLSLARLVEAA